MKRDAWHDYVRPLRACDLCEHGVGPDGQRDCTHPACTGSSTKVQPVELMRKPTGPCGPDANFLAFPGLV
jgi:hypothetical protein